MTLNDIKDLYREYHVPLHIIHHMKKVAMVARFIAHSINQKEGNGIVDVEIVEKGGLLHDFLKICDLKEIDIEALSEEYSGKVRDFWKKLIEDFKDVSHEQAEKKILLDRGEKELANLVSKSGYKALFEANPLDRPGTLEEKVLFYADKRVLHDQIVPLKKRLSDGAERYKSIGKQDQKEWPAIFQLEGEICEKAGISPEEISESSLKSADDPFQAEPRQQN